MNKLNETVYLYVRDVKNKDTWPKFNDKPVTSAMEKWLRRNLNKSYQEYVVDNEFYKITIQRFEKRNNSESNTVFKAKLFHKDIPDYITVDLRMDDFFDIVEKCGMTNSFELEDKDTSFFIYKNHNSYGITYRGSEKEKDCIMEERAKQSHKKVMNQTVVTKPVPFTVFLTSV